MPCIKTDYYSVEKLHGHHEAAYELFSSEMPASLSRHPKWIAKPFKQASTGKAEIIDIREWQEAKDHAIAVNKWKVAIQNPLAETSIKALALTAKILLETIQKFGVEKITFTGLDIDSVQVEHLATALRASSKWKDQIAGWKVALEKAQTICDREKIDPADLLFGMI